MSRIGEVREQRVGLEDDPEVALADRQGRDVPARLLDRPLALHIEAGNGAKQRGLAAARGAEEGDELALPHLEIDALAVR